MKIQMCTQLTSERQNTWRERWIYFNQCTQLSTRKTPHVERLIPYSRVRLQKLKDPQLVKQFHAFCGTQRFVAVFTRAHLLSPSRIKWIQSTPPRSSFHLRHIYCYLGAASIFLLRHAYYMSLPPHSHWFDHAHNIPQGVQITIILMAQLHAGPRYFLPFFEQRL